MTNFSLSKSKTVSVCMATYNGSQFIEEQLTSILNQLDKTDEIIIIDDYSTDDTVDLIKKFKDERITLLINKRNIGHVFSFEKAVSLANNDIIFLSDQDDIWIEGRKDLMIKNLLLANNLLISSNFNVISSNKAPIHIDRKPLRKEDSNKYLTNIIGVFLGKRNYFGCAMAFRKELKNVILPIPAFVESHDLWIALAGNLMKSIWHLENVTITRRLHGKNVSKNDRSFLKKLKSRWLFFLSLMVLIMRKCAINRKAKIHEWIKC